MEESEGVVCRGGLPMTLGETLLVLRRRNGWSQKELSGIAGVRVAVISHVERGGLDVTIGSLTKLAEAFGFSFSVRWIDEGR